MSVLLFYAKDNSGSAVLNTLTEKKGMKAIAAQGSCRFRVR